MTIASTTQTQSTQFANNSVAKTEENSTYQETAKKKHPSRYETLLAMNFDNMSKAEHKELSHYNAMRPVKYLDKAGNAALNKALEGKTDAEKFGIKMMFELEFMTSVKSNAQGDLDRQKFDSVDTSKSANISRFENFLDNNRKGVDPLGIADIVVKFLDIYTNSDSAKDVKNQENSVEDKFFNDLYSKKSTNFQSSVLKDKIENRVNQYAALMMEKRGGIAKSELETSKILNGYKQELLEEYKQSIENSTDSVMNDKQVAIIKVLMEENTQKTSALSALIATKGATTQETQATGKLAQMQEKYKDVYTPIPETYSRKDEEVQTREIHEAYPNYISGPEFFRIVDSFIEGPRIELGQKLTPDAQEKQKADYDQALQKTYDIFGGEEAFTEMQKGAHEIMRKYPVNAWGKDERVHNETELARFTNAATYEALEQGKTIEESRIYAGNLRFSFMDTSYSDINFIETLIKAGRADQSALDILLSQSQEERKKEAYQVDFNAPNNASMDLRKYGIEGDWEYQRVVKSQEGMIAEINKKITQFNFMLHNESKIKEAYQKLDASYQDLGNNAGYKKMINETYMPRMEAGLNIFKNYEIYD